MLYDLVKTKFRFLQSSENKMDTSLRKHPFLLTLRRWGHFARKRNVPSGEERGETDVFAG